MALQLSYTKNFIYTCEEYVLAKVLSQDTQKIIDVVFPSAYIVVETGMYNKSEGTIIASISIYSDSTKTTKISSEVVTFTADTSDSAKNFVSQSYTHLLTLDRYKGAVSV